MFNNKSNAISKIVLGAAGAVAGIGLLANATTPARADIPYNNGFETTDTTTGIQSWWFGSSGSGSYSINQYQSGASTSTAGFTYTGNAQVSAGNGTATSGNTWAGAGIQTATNGGNYYAVITNNENNNGAGIGDGGYTLFGKSTDASPYSGTMAAYPGPFTQSVSVYVPVTGTGAWTNNGTSTTGYGFEIDETADKAPMALSPNWNTEVDFQFSVGASGVDINASDGGAAGGSKGTLALPTITTNGWYTFALTYYKTGNGTTDPVGVTFAEFDQGGNLLGSQSDTLLSAASSDLGGTNYLWFTNWASGFAGNQLAIDNVTATPEPTTLALFAIAGAGALLLLPRRKRQAHV